MISFDTRLSTLNKIIIDELCLDQNVHFALKRLSSLIHHVKEEAENKLGYCGVAKCMV